MKDGLCIDDKTIKFLYTNKAIIKLYLCIYLRKTFILDIQQNTKMLKRDTLRGCFKKDTLNDELNARVSTTYTVQVRPTLFDAITN